MENVASWGFRGALRGCRSLLEKVFVGQCEVLVCLRFRHFILFVYCFPWPRSS